MFCKVPTPQPEVPTPPPEVPTSPPEDGSKFCPDGFKELDKATTDDIGDICRNDKRHECNVGWTCPGDCVAICNREPYCKMPWSEKPCRVKGKQSNPCMKIKDLKKCINETKI